MQTESVSLSSLKKSNQNDGHDEKWYGSLIDKALEKWNSTPEIVMREFAKSGYPCVQVFTPLTRGVSRRKGGEKGSVHHRNADENHRVRLSAQHLQPSYDMVPWTTW